jgi:GNAT superfamily N-acetyltransferase
VRPFPFDPRDLAPGDTAGQDGAARAVSALEGLQLREVTADPGDLPVFREAYAALSAFFGPANEIEREEVLERWLFRPDPAATVRYHLLVAHTADGRLAAVRDGFTALLRAQRCIVALMSHTLVNPPWRRSGLAAVLRAAPAAFAREDAAAQGLPDALRVLVAEMEFVEGDKPDTRIRLVAYGRAGFRVVPPALVPYAQPDFRDLAALGVAAVPVPLVLLVRLPGREDQEALDRTHLAAVFDGLQDIHAPAIQGDQLAVIRARALSASDVDPVPLWSPPTTTDDPAAFAPVSRPGVP